MTMVIALRNFAGVHSMVLTGDIFNLEDPLLTSWTAGGFVAKYIPAEAKPKEPGFKEMITKKVITRKPVKPKKK